jgi:uncharacterized protein (DUF1501 family)
MNTNNINTKTMAPRPGSGQASRRLFLRQAGALSTLGAFGAPLALNLAAIGSAAAQSAGDYKALVCVFMFGGNDAFNTVLATDSASWTNYTKVRRQDPDPIALLAAGTAPNAGSGNVLERMGGVLPIAPARTQGRGFALHPAMGDARRLFDTDRRLAIVANVGPLKVPTTKAQYAATSHPKPANLFSHNDQQNTWQTFEPEGATRGWGGRIGDLLAAGNSQAMFTAISASGNAVWLAGQNVRQYQVANNGAIRMGGNSSGKIFDSLEITAALERIARRARSSHMLEQDLATVAGRSLDAEALLRGALPPASDAAFTGSLSYVDPTSTTGATATNPLAQQMQIVARMIQAGRTGALGVRRQVFFVSLGGFDTHDKQNYTHAKLMAQLSHALAWLDTSLGSLGARGQVTAFTASDFGRTFTSNGDGTDHGWGSHQFVLGGAVRGGDVYGNFPVLGAKNANDNNFDSSPNQVQNGSLLPEVAVDQLGATLAKWFGVADGALNGVFPNLGAFATRDLGFMA